MTMLNWIIRAICFADLRKFPVFSCESWLCLAPSFSFTMTGIIYSFRENVAEFDDDAASHSIIEASPRLLVRGGRLPYLEV